MADDHPVVLQGCRRVLEDAGIEDITLASQIKAKLGVKSLPELMRIAIDHLPEMAGQRAK